MLTHQKPHRDRHRLRDRKISTDRRQTGERPGSRTRAHTHTHTLDAKEVTIMFSDIRDFTTLSESMAPFIAEIFCGWFRLYRVWVLGLRAWFHGLRRVGPFDKVSHASKARAAFVNAGQNMRACCCN